MVAGIRCGTRALYYNDNLQHVIVTVHGEASSCPALPNKKHRAFARCGKMDKISLTSKLDACFYPFSPPCEL